MSPDGSTTAARPLPVAQKTPSSPRPLPVAATSAEGETPPLAGALEPDEIRHSNEVDGFVYKRWKAILYLSQLAFAIPFFPLVPFMIAYDAKDWSIARNYFGTLSYVAKTIVVHLRFGSFVRAIKYNVLMSPEDVEKRLAIRQGACTRCAKCCKQYDCLFLGQDKETKDYFCKVYRSSYWYYGTCGRYPLDQRDIDDHACPGFSFTESPA